MRALMLDKESWKENLMLDKITGLDPPGGIKLRAAQGFDAADFFITGYWIWWVNLYYTQVDYVLTHSAGTRFWRTSQLLDTTHRTVLQQLTIGDYPMQILKYEINTSPS